MTDEAHRSAATAGVPLYAGRMKSAGAAADSGRGDLAVAYALAAISGAVVGFAGAAMLFFK